MFFFANLDETIITDFLLVSCIHLAASWMLIFQFYLRFCCPCNFQLLPVVRFFVVRNGFLVFFPSKRDLVSEPETVARQDTEKTGKTA